MHKTGGEHTEKSTAILIDRRAADLKRVKGTEHNITEWYANLWGG